MEAPSTGVKVRMYRHGHGDCFLLAMRSSNRRSARPVYVLIDCGLKPGSEVKDGQTIDKIIADVGAATGNRLDVVLVTHEHQDHVNGFLKKKPRGGGKLCFDPIKIGELWLAWTEDGDDDFANSLRERFNDTLLGLVHSQQRLAAAGGADQAEAVRELLELETGGDETAGAEPPLLQALVAARARSPHLSLREQGALAIEGISNKRAIQYLRDKAERKPPLFLRPDQGPYAIPGVSGAKVYALGPPRNVDLLLSLDPTGSEEFHFGADPLGAARAFGLDGPSRSFFAAFEGAGPGATAGPFSSRHYIPAERVFADVPADIDPLRHRMLHHYLGVYGRPGDDAGPSPWRRIDGDWLGDSEALALRLNDEVNNTSLVIAIELPATGKVLLFTGDAQRGSWISWSDLSWTAPGASPVTARDLLARTVFYKVGHHGSHNATLDGRADDTYANLAWMARGDFRSEFVAMIPANTPWARGKKKPWDHPLEAIENALKAKAHGRVFRSDVDEIPKPEDVPAGEWKRFKNPRRTTEEDLFFEYTVFDR